MSPTPHIEREVKLDAGVGFRIPDLDGLVPGVRVDQRPDARLQAIYVDTADLRLMRHGVTLRHRQDRAGGAGAERGWTLKLPAPSDGKGLVRKELTWVGGWGPVPRATAAMVRAFDRGAPLVPVARLITQRRRLVLSDGTGTELLEVDDDIVSVMDGRTLAAPFREVEVEVTGAGGEALLGPVVACLVAAGALPGDERPKVVRALGRRATEPPDVAMVELRTHATVREVVAAAIAAGYCRLTEHDPGVRLDEDIEDVHQTRVATRRLRSDLRTFAGVVHSTWAFPLREELGWIAEALGRVRDADVLGLRLGEQVALLEAEDRPAAVPLRKRLEMQRRGAFRDLIEAMDSDRYLRLLDTLAAGAADPPMAQPPAPVEQPAPSESEVDTGGAGPAEAEGDRAESGRGRTIATQASWPSGAVFSGALPAPFNGGGTELGAPAPAGGAVRAPFRLAATPFQPGPAPSPGASSPPAVSSPPVESPESGEAPTPADGPHRSEASTSVDGPEGGEAPIPANGPESGEAPAPADGPGSGEAPAPTDGPESSEVSTSVVGAEGGEAPAPVTPWAGVDPDESGAHALPRLVRKPWRRVVQAIEALDPDPPDEALHEIRIRAKRLRYACEAVAVVVGKPAVRLGKDAAALQGVLGDQHDAVVAEEWLRNASQAAKGPTALVAGQLIASERAAQVAGRDQWLEPAKRVISDDHRVWLSRKALRR